MSKGFKGVGAFTMRTVIFKAWSVYNAKHSTKADVAIENVSGSRSPPLQQRPCLPDTSHGQVLLVKRGREPSKGMWSYPGGSLELGEWRE